MTRINVERCFRLHVRLHLNLEDQKNYSDNRDIQSLGFPNDGQTLAIFWCVLGNSKQKNRHWLNWCSLLAVDYCFTKKEPFL